MMLSRSLRIVNESDLEHLGTEIMRFEEHNHAMHNGHICGYGRSHRLFNHRWHRDVAAYDNRHRRIYSRQYTYSRQYLTRPSDKCVDLAGTLFAVGRSTFVCKVVRMNTPKLSRYYKGYLVLCAARCSFDLEDNTEFCLSQQAENLKFLVKSDADLRSPQVVVGVSKSYSLLHRPPWLEVQLFILRALTHFRGLRFDTRLR